MECAHRFEAEDSSRDARDCHVLKTHIRAGGFDTTGDRELHAITSAVL